MNVTQDTKKVTHKKTVTRYIFMKNDKILIEDYHPYIAKPILKSQELEFLQKLQESEC